MWKRERKRGRGEAHNLYDAAPLVHLAVRDSSCSFSCWKRLSVIPWGTLYHAKGWEAKTNSRVAQVAGAERRSDKTVA